MQPSRTTTEPVDEEFDSHSKWIRSLRSDYDQRTSLASNMSQRSEYTGYDYNDSARDEEVNTTGWGGVGIDEEANGLAVAFDESLEFEEAPVYRSLGGFGAVDLGADSFLGGEEFEEGPVYRGFSHESPSLGDAHALDASAECEANWLSTNPPLIQRQHAFGA